MNKKNEQDDLRMLNSSPRVTFGMTSSQYLMYHRAVHLLPKTHVSFHFSQGLTKEHLDMVKACENSSTFLVNNLILVFLNYPTFQPKKHVNR